MAKTKRPPEEGMEQSMVHWFDPHQMLVTGARVVVSYLLRERLDRRVMDAVTARHVIFDFDHAAADRDEFWLDYVADVADGYNPTYEVAKQLARPQLDGIDPDGSPLPRGHVLVMGGDEVYPTASREEYDRRLRLPYGRAFPKKVDGCRPAPSPDDIAEIELTRDNRSRQPMYAKVMPADCLDRDRFPALFALPGNHDWYDGLACFTRLFAQERTMGGLQTYQSRSYFALQLPFNWWLLALDVQLTDYIDKPQLDYFEDVIAQMSEGDNVILCMSTPSWEEAEGFGFMTREDFWASRDSHMFLEKKIEHKAHIRLWLAGDWHYYRRYECREPGTREVLGHMVTCGGGGAFTHPTHTRRVTFSTAVAGDEVHLEEKAVYPDRVTSRSIAPRRALAMVNPRIAYGAGLVTSFVYLVLGWYAVSPFATLTREIDRGAPGQGLVEFVFSFLLNPFALFWLTVSLGVCYTLAPRAYKRWSKLSSAAIHLAAHLATIAALCLAGLWLAPRLAWLVLQAIYAVAGVISVESTVDQLSDRDREYLAIAVVAFGGFWLGKLVLVGYLVLGVTFTNVQGNNAFAMLRVQDYKSFLRMRLHPGGLDVYAIKIARVGRYRKPWRQRDSSGPEIIEKFTIPAARPGPESTRSSGPAHETSPEASHGTRPPRDGTGDGSGGGTG